MSKVTLKEVRRIKTDLEKYQERVEFIPMFTSLLLDLLNAYETEIERLDLQVITLNDEINSLNVQLENAQDDAIHGEDI